MKKHVEGKKYGEVLLYALSTCGWCRKTKKLLGELDVDYDYIDADLADEEEKKKIERLIAGWGRRVVFPTVVINGSPVVGYDPDAIKEKLKKHG